MGIEELLLDRAIKQGIEEGLKEGMKQGMREGMKKGRHQKALEIAHELKKQGLAIVLIAEFTELSVEEIEKL